MTDELTPIQKAKLAYINGEGSYRALAKEYGLSAGYLMQIGAAEGWAKQKTKHLSIVEEKAKKEIADRLAEEMVKESATKARIRGKIWKLAEKWFESQEAIADTADYRRMVQTCIDLGIVEDVKAEAPDLTIQLGEAARFVK